MIISLPDTSLHIFDQGTGPPLLLVHGFPLDHTMWMGQIGTLANDYRVIAPDLRGFGKSTGGGGTTTMAQLADDLAAMLDALGILEKIVLCGLSMGGYVALPFWKRHGKRLRGLVLCDTRTAADAPEAAANRLAMAERVVKDGPAFVADAMLPRLFPPNTSQTKPLIYEATRQMILNTKPETIAAALRGMAERPDMSGELAKIDVPTLVICGENDAIAPVEEMREIAAAIPGGQFEVIASVGHMSPLEDPAAFNAVLESFLKSLS